MVADKVLACGHAPSPHGEHTTGTVHIDGKGEICWACGEVWEREQLRAVRKWSGYMRHDPDTSTWSITNWTGAKLGAAYNVRTHRNNFGATIYTFRMTMFDGAEWYGRGMGDGMFCRITRATSR